MAYDVFNGPPQGCNIEHRMDIGCHIVFVVHENCEVHPETWTPEFIRWNVLPPYSEADIRLTQGYFAGFDPAHIEPNPEEGNVSNFSQTVIDSYKAMIKAQREEEAAKLLLALVESFGSDDYEAGTVLRWWKNFNKDDDKRYSYAAIKADGMWYSTARSGMVSRPQTFEDLVLWLISRGSSVAPEEVEVWFPIRTKFDQDHDRPETIATHVAWQKQEYLKKSLGEPKRV